MLLVVQQQWGAARAPCLSLLLGCSSRFSAAGRFPLLGAERSCSPRTWPPASAAVPCRALLLRIALNLNLTPLRQKKTTPNQPKNKSHHPCRAFSCLPYWRRWAALLQRKCLNCRIYEKQASHHIKKTLKLSFTNDRRNHSPALCFYHWGPFSGRWVGLYRVFLLTAFAFSAIQPGDASLSCESDSRNAPNTASPAATTFLDWQSSCSPLYFTHTGSEHSPELRPVHSFLIVWNFSRYLLVWNSSPGCISFWGLSVKTSFPGDAFCSVSNQPESNEHNWLLPQDKMNKLIRFIISYNKCVYLPGSFQHGTSWKWKKGRGERGVPRVENSGKRSRPAARLRCVMYSIARTPHCCSAKPQFAAVVGLLK